MLKRIFAVLFLTLFAAPIAVAADKVCVVASKEEMLATNGIKGISEVEPDRIASFLAKLNAVRAEKGVFALEADSMVIALFGDDTVAFALFKDGCLVPGTAFRGPVKAMKDFLVPFDAVDLLDKVGRGA